MSKIMIDDESCIACGTCSNICPASIIELENFPSVSEENSESCIKCGQCEAVCAQSALELVDPSIERTGNNRINFKGTSEQIGNYIRSRRSIRHYKNKIVDKKILEDVMDIVRYAPSGGNNQAVKWMIIHDPVKVKKLAGLTIEWIKNMIDKNPSDPNMAHLKPLVDVWDNESDPILRGAPHLIIAYARLDKDNPMAQFVNIDGTIALTHLDLALPSFGLGSCWAGGLSMALNEWPPIAKELKLPKDHIFIGAMMVGYPQYQYHNIPKRNKVDINWK